MLSVQDNGGRKSVTDDDGIGIFFFFVSPSESLQNDGKKGGHTLEYYYIHFGLGFGYFPLVSF